MKKTKRPGDIFAIPLPDGRYGFGLCFRASLCGVYQHIGASQDDLPENRRFLFVTAINNASLNSNDWPVVSQDPVGKNRGTQFPGQFIYDEQTDSYSIYDAATGEDVPASKEQCFGLEEVAAWSATHVIQRLLPGGRHAWLGAADWVPYGVEYHEDGSFCRYNVDTGEAR